MPVTSSPTDAGYWAVAALLAGVAAAFVTYRAWVTDDAFITFRHILNVHAGNGPVFNPGFRVQGYTHPLWFLLLLAGSYVMPTYAAAVACGLALTVVAVAALAWFLRAYPGRSVWLLAAFLALFSSRTFVEYQTSGLETSLTALLVILLFGWVASRELADRPVPVVGVAWLCAMLVLNRPDYVIFCGPVAAGLT
ncbi:MAG: hypothetical protein HY718_13055 [Planctomycetes bacterium]|nr:hypothetical protein [Planctomycetota bacterium]